MTNYEKRQTYDTDGAPVPGLYHFVRVGEEDTRLVKEDETEGQIVLGELLTSEPTVPLRHFIVVLSLLIAFIVTFVGLILAKVM